MSGAGGRGKGRQSSGVQIVLKDTLSAAPFHFKRRNRHKIKGSLGKKKTKKTKQLHLACAFFSKPFCLISPVFMRMSLTAVHCRTPLMFRMPPEKMGKLKSSANKLVWHIISPSGLPDTCPPGGMGGCVCVCVCVCVC